jgi:hypothetical protein
MEGKNIKITQRNRIIVGISIILVIALIHIFRVGSHLKGELYLLYYSYVSDLIIPFGIYFLLCIDELFIKILRKWYIKASIILGFTVLMEILQLFGIYALGNTFDLVDILMYGLGVVFAIVFDRLLFKRFIPFWELDKMNENIRKNNQSPW